MRSAGAYDQELMRDLLQGTPEALERIIEKWERPLYAFIYRYTQNEFATRDIVQETFVRVFTKRKKYNFSYPFSSWVFTIAANLCKNRARWRKRHPETSLEGEESRKEGFGRSLLEVLPAEDELPIDAMERDEDLRALKRAVAELPHDLRTTVLLHHYQELSYKEISEVVGCSVRGVETRLYRARKLLKLHLGESLGRDENAQKKTAQPKAGAVRKTYSTAACALSG